LSDINGHLDCPDWGADQGNLDEGDAISEEDGYPVTTGDAQPGQIARDSIDGRRQFGVGDTTVAFDDRNRGRRTFDRCRNIESKSADRSANEGTILPS
jgi:hypothetical protein